MTPSSLTTWPLSVRNRELSIKAFSILLKVTAKKMALSSETISKQEAIWPISFHRKTLSSVSVSINSSLLRVRLSKSPL
jgi:hypothetical protein